MTGPSGDPVVDRAVNELQRLPPLDDLAVRRIVTAAAAAQDSSGADVSGIQRRLPRRRPTAWMAVGVAAAAAVAGFMLRGAWPAAGIEHASTAHAIVAKPAATIPTPVERMQFAAAPAAPAADAVPIPTQFVLRSAAARSVSVVGDFNGWNPRGARLTRSSGGDLWSITIPIAPGRHTYGFMVDDSEFTLDPRAPKTRDPDLGVDGSVVIVGRP